MIRFSIRNTVGGAIVMGVIGGACATPPARPAETPHPDVIRYVATPAADVEVIRVLRPDRIHRVFFGVGSGLVPPFGRTTVDDLARDLVANPTLTVEVWSYADDRMAARATSLLERRVEAILTLLARAGVDPNRIRKRRGDFGTVGPRWVEVHVSEPPRPQALVAALP